LKGKREKRALTWATGRPTSEQSHSERVTWATLKFGKLDFLFGFSLNFNSNSSFNFDSSFSSKSSHSSLVGAGSKHLLPFMCRLGRSLSVLGGSFGWLRASRAADAELPPRAPTWRWRLAARSAASREGKTRGKLVK